MLALGTPGSYGILQTQAQALVQYLDFGLALQDAIEAAARAAVGRPQRRSVESRMPAATVLARSARARPRHRRPSRAWTMRVGGMQAVAVDPATAVMTGAADPRRDGYAVAL